MLIREPAVAGLFYPADKHELRQYVGALLGPPASPRAEDAASQPKALIVPHAGYIYSGAVAASVYQMLFPWRQNIKRIILLGPAHRVYLQGMAIPSAAGFRTPLGTVALDTGALANLATQPGVHVADDAHAQEHCLEVQLPFLQVLLDTFSLVPIVVGQCAPQQVAGVIDSVWGGAETLLIISSDLSHYLPYTKAQAVDHLTEQRILHRDATLGGNEACGAHAINGLLVNQHVADLKITSIDMRNSGDTAGDKSRVVGYGAFILY